MKKISVVLVSMMISLVAWTQNGNFEAEMLKRTQQIESTHKTVDYLKLSKEFETLAKANPKQFEALYYQALCLVFNSFEETDKKQKDPQLDQAIKLLDKALLIKPQNAELYILKALDYQMKIDIDPMNRGYEFSQKAEQQLAKAFALDPKNPRYFFLKGQNLFYTPEQYGGGKLKAKPYFEKAAKWYKKSKKNNPLDPTWGQETNAIQLNNCKK